MMLEDCVGRPDWVTQEQEGFIMSCEACGWRAKYDKNPKSFLGRLWRWHIGFCPGWKKYFRELPEDKKKVLSNQYRIE
jgi:hypothetical protein